MFSLGTMTPASWIRAETITEIVGELSSGRTSLMLACLRDVTVAGGTAALVDADGAFDPASAARAGVVLSRLLWVRCGGRRDAALAATDLLALSGVRPRHPRRRRDAAARVARRGVSAAPGRASCARGGAARRATPRRGRGRDAGAAHAARRAGVDGLASRADATGGHEHARSRTSQSGCDLGPVAPRGDEQ